MVNSGLRDLKEEIEDMSEEEKEIENPNEIINLVENIIEINRQQQGQGLKILTPSQMLSRLPISLAQLKAGNNSEKPKNQIRQLLYSLYRSKELTKNSIKVCLTLFKKRKQSLWTLETVNQANHTDLNWVWQINLISKTQAKIWL